jgi:hypothetical protein
MQTMAYSKVTLSLPRLVFGRLLLLALADVAAPVHPAIRKMLRINNIQTL